jgi:hypothetical protein
MNLPNDIFKAYDIRGIVGKTLTAPVVQAVGQALGTLAQERGRDTLVVGPAGRYRVRSLPVRSRPESRASGAQTSSTSAWSRRRSATSPQII